MLLLLCLVIPKLMTGDNTVDHLLCYNSLFLTMCIIIIIEERLPFVITYSYCDLLTISFRVVLTTVPLELDPDVPQVGMAVSHDFPRSWMLPMLRESVGQTELSYFTDVMLPLAGKLRTKSMWTSLRVKC